MGSNCYAELAISSPVITEKPSPVLSTPTGTHGEVARLSGPVCSEKYWHGTPIKDGHQSRY